MKKLASTDKWKKQQAIMTKKARAVTLSKDRYSPEFKAVVNICGGAKDRCTNPNNRSYHRYGGRGIKFAFSTTKEMAEWVVDNLGYRPSNAHSIDRIDNNRHYERGNLRWATAVEQANNKRAYTVGAVGARIRVLQKERPDLSYETIRTEIKKGWSDEEIIAKVKWKQR